MRASGWLRPLQPMRCLASSGPRHLLIHTTPPALVLGVGARHKGLPGDVGPKHMIGDGASGGEAACGRREVGQRCCQVRHREEEGEVEACEHRVWKRRAERSRGPAGSPAGSG